MLLLLAWWLRFFSAGRFFGDQGGRGGGRGRGRER